MFADAEVAIRAGLAAGARDPGMIYRLAIALGGQGRFTAARDYFESYLRVRPRDPAARTALAGVLAAIASRLVAREPPEVIARYADRILELDPDNPKGMMLRAHVARAAFDLVMALELLERVRVAMPDDPEVVQLYAESLRDRGWQLQLAGDDEAALDAFVRFVAIAPPSIPTEAVKNAILQHWRVRLKRGQEALIAGDAAAAEVLLSRCLELRPEILQLGMALLQLHRPGDALACFEIAERGQLDKGFDRSLAVLYQVHALRALELDDDARECARAYLDAPDTDADPDVLSRLRDAVDR
jgi:tetratricopeptide (TPR) repeat protein